MRRRTEQLFNNMVVPFVLVVNMAGAVTLVGGGLPLPNSAPPTVRTSIRTPSPSPTNNPTSTSSVTAGPSATAAPTITPEPQINGYVTRTYVSPDGLTMTYYLHIPSDYLPSQRYPLVFLLHGSGESSTTSRTPQRNAIQLLSDPYVKQWSSASIQTNWPSFILVPQVVTPARWAYGLPHTGSYTLQAQPQPALGMAMAILANVQTLYSIDPQRIYLTGLSMGGYGAWEAAERWPDTFAAVVPIAGAGDPSKAADLVHTPVWAFQSAGDTVVPISASLDMIGAIKKAGGHPCFTEFSGKAHDISTWMAVYTNGAMLLWLFAQGTPAAMAAGMQHCSA